VESSSKSCTEPRVSRTSYTYNFSYCAAKEDLVNEDDADCDSQWTCDPTWVNADCVSNDDGGKRKQTQTCTDQYGSSKTNEQIVGDSTVAVRKPRPAGNVLLTAGHGWNILLAANPIVRELSPRRNLILLALAVIPIGKIAVAPAIAR